MHQLLFYIGYRTPIINLAQPAIRMLIIFVIKFILLFSSYVITLYLWSFLYKLITFRQRIIIHMCMCTCAGLGCYMIMTESKTANFWECFFITHFLLVSKPTYWYSIGEIVSGEWKKLIAMKQLTQKSISFICMWCYKSMWYKFNVHPVIKAELK